MIFVILLKYQLTSTIALKFHDKKTFFMYTGSDAILLGAETLRGLYPVETISTVGRICAEVNTLC